MSTTKEKSDALLPSTAPARVIHQSEKASNLVRNVVLIVLLWACGLWSHRVIQYFDRVPINDAVKSAALCPQVEVLTPEKNEELWRGVGATIGTDEFKVRAINWLSGAVRVPTESYDDMRPVGEDPRWEAFGPFHDYLLESFPLVHTSLELKKVNTYGLWYTWKGSDDSKKPVLFAAHQDVVPVDPATVDQWTHPPYSGHFDGQRIWGRGSSDDKSGLIGVLSAVESLLEIGFQPSRTVVLSFGIDEESSGVHGAGQLSNALLEAYGEDAFAFIIDEGTGFMKQFGTVFATPGIAEKGYLDVRIDVTAPGGHSSIPPPHTSIGLLSSLLVKYEANPYEVNLARESPVYTILQCYAEHAESLPSPLRKTIKRSARSKKALRKLEKTLFADPMYKSLVGTTQAIDLIQGGVKTNALPEQAWAVVNHRISTESSVADVKAHSTALLASLASTFNLTYNAFGTLISKEGAPSSGTLTLSDAWNSALEPAPITPTGKGAAPYQLLSGTIKAAYNAHRSLEGSDTITVSPGMMSGNTDTQFYWKLSQHIFRYNHQNGGDGSSPLGAIHTVNEWFDVDAFLEMIRFFTTLILNADESSTI